MGGDILESQLTTMTGRAVALDEEIRQHLWAGVRAVVQRERQRWGPVVVDRPYTVDGGALSV